MNVVEKSIKFLGRELIRVERNRAGEFSYSFLDGNGFVNSSKYLDMSLENPVLLTVILMRARLFSQMQIKHVNSKGEEIKNSPYIQLLSQPNYFQSQQDFLFQLMWFLSATGSDYIYEIKGTKEVPNSIYNLIPSEIDFKDVNKVNKFITTSKDKTAFEDQIITYKLDNQTYKLRVGDITPLYDMANGLKPNSFMASESRVKGLTNILENIEQNLSSKHKNLQFSAKYIGRNQSNGNEAQIQPADKKSIERVLSQKDVLTTNANIEYKHLVSDMKRLYLDEQFADDANKVLLAFELDKNVLNYFAKDSTFENKNQGIISVIQGSIQTSADSTMNSLSSQWGLIEKGEKLIASYDHLPVMQTVINDKITSFMNLQTAIKQALENGTMTDKEAIEMTNSLIQKLKL